MLVIVGFVFVTLCVFGGFALAGGKLGVLWQPIELLIIAGAGIGSAFIQAPMSVLKMVMGQVGKTFKNNQISQEEYIELLMLLFELCKKFKTDMLSLEPHVEDPEKSDIFTKYPRILHHHHVIHFISDTLKVQISSGLSPYDLEDLMDTDLNSAHAEEGKGPTIVNRVSDAMPGLGIVAAVLGVVLTMGKLTQGKEVIGHSVAAALVGTFIGILISYGYLGPLAAKMSEDIAEEGQMINVVKTTILALAKDGAPKVCVEFGRRTIPPSVRPDFNTVDQATQNIGKAA
jgi:chemotaxis protein MotA